MTGTLLQEIEQTPKGSMQSEKALEIDFLALLSAVYRRKIWVMGAVFVGVGLGALQYYISPRIYTATVVFTNESSEDKGGRLQQLALLAGNFGGGLGTETSPFVNFIGRYSKTREFTDQLASLKYGDSTLPQILVRGEVYKGDTASAFNNAVASLYELKKDKDGLLVLKVNTRSPEFSYFMAMGVFGALDKSVREKKRQSTNSKLEFVNSLVEKYQVEMKDASDRMRLFLDQNRDASSPALMQKRGFLVMDQKLAEEKYLLAVKQREELRIQLAQRENQLIVLDPAYRPLFPSSPTKAKSMAPPIALLALLCITFIAYLDRRSWIYPT